MSAAPYATSPARPYPTAWSPAQRQGPGPEVQWAVSAAERSIPAFLESRIEEELLFPSSWRRTTPNPLLRKEGAKLVFVFHNGVHQRGPAITILLIDLRAMVQQELQQL